LIIFSCSAGSLSAMTPSLPKRSQAENRQAWKRGATRLGFAILLRFYTQHIRFPRGAQNCRTTWVERVAKRVQLPASELGFYEWSGSTIEYHRHLQIGDKVVIKRYRS
jgi:hypothetical protein